MKGKYEKGSLIVEASIVFPVMFLVIFFMIFAGNAFLQMCRIESIVNELAIDGAAYCADPQLENIEGGSFPSVDGLEVYPYRFLLSGATHDTAGSIESRIQDRISSMSSGLFSEMKPEDIDVEATYEKGFFYATLSVNVECRVKIPVRLLGQDENLYYVVSTHSEMPVSDTPEFMRNIDMVWDYMEKFGIDKKFSKLGEMLDKAVSWLTTG